MKRLLLLFVLLPACQDSGRLPVSDADLSAVREWLRENTDSGEWEEVRWWPARQVEIHNGRDYGTRRVARIKYRTSGLGGGSVLIDRYFEMKDGRVIAASETEWWGGPYAGYHLIPRLEKAFPD